MNFPKNLEDLRYFREALNLRAPFLVECTSQIMATVKKHSIFLFFYFTCQYPTLFLTFL